MTKFNKNEVFCAKCLTHETFFTGGGSWSPDFCPTCKDVNADVTLYKNLTIKQKRIARKKFDEMWKEHRLHLYRDSLDTSLLTEIRNTINE